MIGIQILINDTYKMYNMYNIPIYRFGQCLCIHIYFFSADELDSFINEIANSGKCECSQCSGQDGFNISVALVPVINSVGYV